MYPTASCTWAAGRRGSSRCCATSCGAGRTCRGSACASAGRSWSTVSSPSRHGARGVAHDRRRPDRHGGRAAVRRIAATYAEALAAGVYDGEGPSTDLLAGPRWAALDRALVAGDRVRSRRSTCVAVCWARTSPARRGALGAILVARAPGYRGAASGGRAARRLGGAGLRPRTGRGLRRRHGACGGARHRWFDHGGRMAGSHRRPRSTGSRRTSPGPVAPGTDRCGRAARRRAPGRFRRPARRAPPRRGHAAGSRPTFASRATTASSSRCGSRSSTSWLRSRRRAKLRSARGV